MTLQNLSFAKFHRLSHSKKQKTGGFLGLINLLGTTIPWLNHEHDCIIHDWWDQEDPRFQASCRLSPKWKLHMSWTGKGPTQAEVLFVLVKNTSPFPVGPSWTFMDWAQAIQWLPKPGTFEPRFNVDNPDLIGALSAMIGAWARRNPVDAHFIKWEVAPNENAPTLDIPVYDDSTLTIPRGAVVWTNPNLTAVGFLQDPRGSSLCTQVQNADGQWKSWTSEVELAQLPTWHGLSYKEPDIWSKLGFLQVFRSFPQLQTPFVPVQQNGVEWDGLTPPKTPPGRIWRPVQADVPTFWQALPE